MPTDTERRNLEVIPKWLEYYNHDVTRMVKECYAPDCLVDCKGGISWQGHAAFIAIEIAVEKSAPQRKAEILETIAAGDRVIVQAVLKDPSKGADWKAPFCARSSSPGARARRKLIHIVDHPPAPRRPRPRGMVHTVNHHPRAGARGPQNRFTGLTAAPRWVPTEWFTTLDIGSDVPVHNVKLDSLMMGTASHPAGDATAAVANDVNHFRGLFTAAAAVANDVNHFFAGGDLPASGFAPASAGDAVDADDDGVAGAELAAGGVMAADDAAGGAVISGVTADDAAGAADSADSGLASSGQPARSAVQGRNARDRARTSELFMRRERSPTPA